MSVPYVKFKVEDRPEFFKELRKRVNLHFKEKNISRHANLNMKLKTVFMLSLYFTPFVLMVSGVVTGLWPVILMWAIMGFGMSGIGLSIMHDANHGSYSKNNIERTQQSFLRKGSLTNCLMHYCHASFVTIGLYNYYFFFMFYSFINIYVRLPFFICLLFQSHVKVLL